MLGQTILAQHSASHIEHDFSQKVLALHDHNHDEHHHKHDTPHQKHECPECLLTKSLQTAFYHAPITLSIIIRAEAFSLQQDYEVVSLNPYRAHPPRAPPAHLI